MEVEKSRNMEVKKTKNMVPFILIFMKHLSILLFFNHYIHFHHKFSVILLKYYFHIYLTSDPIAGKRKDHGGRKDKNHGGRKDKKHGTFYINFHKMWWI